MSDHLSEEQIQLYLDNQEIPNVKTVEKHLNECSDCRKRMEEYRQVYVALSSDPFPALPKEFSKQVVSRISGTSESKWQFFESGFIVAFFLIGAAVGLYFINPLPFLSNSIGNFFNNIGGYTTKFLPELNGHIPILIVAVLIFLLVEVIDKKVIRSRS